MIFTAQRNRIALHTNATLVCVVMIFGPCKGEKKKTKKRKQTIVTMSRLGSPGSFLKETFVYLVANIDLRFQLLQWLKPPGSPDAATAGGFCLLLFFVFCILLSYTLMQIGIGPFLYIMGKATKCLVHWMAKRLQN